MTFVDVDGDGRDRRRLSVTARLDAVLDDGRHIVLLADRGWSAEARGEPTSSDADIWANTSVKEIAETARVVVGPDEPFGEFTREDAEAGYWAQLARVLADNGVTAGAGAMQRLSHDVRLSDRLLARLGLAT